MGATPRGSVPLASDKLTEVAAVYAGPVPTRPVAATEPPVGPAESSTKVRVVAAVLPATSLPVTTSSGSLDVPGSR